MTSNAHELGVSVGAWNAVVRRARIGRERKAASLVVSSYARADGTRIHCGVARLAVDLEVSYSTARRYLAWLRGVGLIELVRAGNRRRNLSDEYRLILGPDVTEHLEVLDPDEHKKLTDGLRESNRSGLKARRERAIESDQRPSGVSADDAPPAEVQRSSRVSAKTGDQRSNQGRSALTLDERPSLRCISPEDLSPRNPDDGDLEGSLTLGAREANPKERSVVVEIYPGASQEPPCRPPPRRSTRGQDTVAEAMARAEERRATHRAHKEAT